MSAKICGCSEQYCLCVACGDKFTNADDAFNHEKRRCHFVLHGTFSQTCRAVDVLAHLRDDSTIPTAKDLSSREQPEEDIVDDAD